jgi:hypothetical protein
MGHVVENSAQNIIVGELEDWSDRWLDHLTPIPSLVPVTSECNLRSRVD